MKRIFKYPLHDSDANVIEMPEDAQVLTVQMQAGLPTLWALVDDEAAPRKRVIRVLGTGQAVPDHFEYIGTVQMGALVWHIGEVSR